MTDDHGDQDNRRSEAATSEEWVDKIAESEGLAREDVLERLVSSYWTLKEMVQLMEGAEGTLDPGDDVGDSPASIGVSPEEFESFRERVAEDLDTIRAELETLSAAVDDNEGALEGLSAEIDAVDDRVDEVESSLAGRQDELSDRLDQEFENLEVILDYLIETTDDIDDRTAILAGDALDIQRRWSERDRLAELKTLANRAGVTRARCEYCSTDVEIGLLERPECPQCDRPIVDLEPNKGWFGFGTSKLMVSNEPVHRVESEPSHEGNLDESEQSTGFDLGG